jgi:hypothetical protein
LAAKIPASRAAASTSPFSTRPAAMRAEVSLAMRTRPRATATRSVRGFSPT